DDLLDMSRTVTGKLTLQNGLVDLESVVHAAIDTHRPAASAKSLHLDVDTEPDLPTVPGDASRLQQVVSNLLANAIKFTPHYGRITVCTRRTAEGIELRVSDTGAGIDPALLPKVFEPFRQGHSSTSGEGGLGLGLAIVAALVQAHGGTVEAASNGAGAGSTFVVRLPAQQRSDRQKA
ncbi:MAG: HAMP domain-containing sensor histidine kinase, partial [Acidobacteriota bacterium]